MSRGEHERLWHQAEEIVNDLRSGRLAIISGRLDPQVRHYIDEILSGQTTPPYENSDD